MAKKICKDCGGVVLFKEGATEIRDAHGNDSYRCWTCMRSRVQNMIEENRRALGLDRRR